MLPLHEVVVTVVMAAPVFVILDTPAEGAYATVLGTHSGPPSSLASEPSQVFLRELLMGS